MVTILYINQALNIIFIVVTDELVEFKKQLVEVQDLRSFYKNLQNMPRINKEKLKYHNMSPGGPVTILGFSPMKTSGFA